ncbi:IS6 family transposase [Parachitinimonas caeni]|uniref:IS6 family transposase n=1 Tax=Parachitinimonas caeni TaxID=3031301 RepID=A0ABT7E3W3_9NEIS|nr:IS6 family transposase [Parachitinimonas caeni]MDK2127007.1 IS6 family transposase [Parachitinimonas caeni]
MAESDGQVDVERETVRFPVDIILQCVRWVVAYPLSYRQNAEMMAERGVQVDLSTLQRGAIRFLPVLTERFRQLKKTVGPQWRRDETDVRISGKWQYCYRAVDSEGKTVDCLLYDKRDHAAALSCFQQAIDQHGHPEGVAIDKSGSNQSALIALNAEDAPTIQIRQNKYLNNLIEQDYRAIKRRTQPMLGFKDAASAAIILSGIELMHALKKGQLNVSAQSLTPEAQFYGVLTS